MKRTLLAFTFLCTIAFSLFGDWEQCGGIPSPIQITSISGIDNQLFIGTYDEGLIATSDTGKSWSSIMGKGSTVSALYSDPFLMLSNQYLNDPFIFNEINISNDNGKTWSSKEISDDVGTTFPTIIYWSGNMLFVGCNDEGDATAYRSPDSGNTWVRILNLIPDSYISSFMSVPNKLFMSIVSDTETTDLRVSTDSGSTWEKLSNSFGNSTIFGLWNLGNVLIAASDSNSWESSDTGKTWSLSSRLPQGSRIASMCQLDKIWYASIPDSGIYITKDSGLVFSKVSATKKIYNLSPVGNMIAGSSVNGEIMFSTDKGKNWTKRQLTFDNNSYSGGSAAVIGSRIIQSNKFRSTNNGNSWLEMTDTILSGYDLNFVTTVNDTIFAGITSGFIASGDSGKTWIKWNAYIDTATPLKIEGTSTCYYVQTKNNIKKMMSNNNSWSTITLPNIGNVDFFSSDNNCLIVGNESQLALSINNGDTWKTITSKVPLNPTTETPNPTISSAVIHNSQIIVFVYYSKENAATLETPVAISYVSTDMGETYQNEYSISYDGSGSQIAKNSNTVFFAHNVMAWDGLMSPSVCLYSTDTKKWATISDKEVNDMDYYSGLSANENFLFAGLNSRGIRRFNLSDIPDVAILNDNTTKNAHPPLRIISATNGFTLKYTPQNMKISQPEISVFDIAGRKIKTTMRKVQGSWEISIPNIVPGIYLYQISDIDYVRNGRYVFTK